MTMTDDDDGFAGYVETTVDPGSALVFATALFCVVSNLMLPCLVTLGRRYEKRRMVLVESSTEEDNEEGSDKDQEEASEKPADEQSNFEDNVSVTLSSYMHGRPPTASSSNVQVVHGLRGVFDKILMPPYPDDKDNAIISGGIFAAKARSTVSESKSEFSSAQSGVSVQSHATTTILDTPGLGKRCRTRGRKLTDERRWIEEIRKEARIEHKEWGIASDVSGPPLPTISELAGNALRTVAAQHDGSSDVGGTAYPTRSPSELAGRSEVESALSNRTGVSSRARGRRRYGPSSDLQSNVSGVEPSVLSRLEDDVVSPMDAADAHDPGRQKPIMAGDEELDLCCGKHAWWRPAIIGRGLDRLVQIAEYDREMKRIVNLSIPMCMEGFFVGLFEVLTVAIISQFLGTDAVAAYTIVDLILGLPIEFFGGFGEALSTLCSQAYGGGNDRLCGQYVQIGAIFFVAFMIPTTIIGVFVVEDIIKLLGFDDATAQMAREYAPFMLTQRLVEGVDACYYELLDVIGHERYGTLLGIMDDAVGFAIVTSLAATRNDFGLREVGIIHLLISIVFAIFNVCFTTWKKWVKRHTGGMFRSWAFGNYRAVKAVWNMALPLSFGFLLQYGEWEVLTIFAAALGPAEVAAWGILGTLWEAFEGITEGIADGGEIRVAYHLGAGNPAKAKKAAYKAVLFGMFMGALFTSSVFILGDDLVVWFTSDPTLQRLMVDLLPLLGLGNLTLTAGIVSWGLVGGQGRYRLATTVAFVSSWLITMPIAAIFTYVFNFDLQGMTSAVVIGYSCTNTVLLYVLIRSDWDRLSRIVRELHALEDTSEAGLLGDQAETMDAAQIPQSTS